MGFPPLEMNDVIPNCTVKIYMYNEYLYMYQLRKSVLHTSGVHTLYMYIHFDIVHGAVQMFEQEITQL